MDRPALTALLAQVRAGRIASVTVIKLDRLTRSVRDLGELLEIFRRADCALISVSETLDTSSAPGRSFAVIAADLERRSIPPPRFARWYSTSVRNVLLSKMTLDAA